MKNLLLLGTLSFTIAFSCGLVVEKNVTKSAAIGAIATISTLSGGLVLSKVSEKERQKLQGQTEKVKSLESQISSLTEKKTNLVKVINNKTRSKTKVEQEYNAKLKEIDQLKEEINSLKLQRDTLQDVILNLENKEKKIPAKRWVKLKDKPIKSTGLYNYILEGLEKSLVFYDPQEHKTFENYLESLQPGAEELWSAYRFNQVQVNYGDPSIQAAYLIRYYPHYAYMNYQILEMIHRQNLFKCFTDETLEVCLFGAGPCPEIVGLSKLLSENYQFIKKLVVNVYDIAGAQWSLSREITEKFIVPEYWSGDLTVNSHYLDLCEFNSLNSIKNNIKISKLFVFQNCLNEIYNVSTVQFNLNFLLDEIPVGGAMVIIDLYNYRQNVTIVDELEKQVKNRSDFEIYCPPIDTLNIKACPNLPQIIKKHLLTSKGRLVPRSKDIQCLFISLHKII